MKLATFAVIASTFAALTAPAFAQPGAPTPEQRAARFDAGDTDKDGKLTKAEFVAQLPEQAKAMADQIWARYDAAGKGSVTKAEYLAVQPMQRQ
jgi:hypothetical protein